MHYLLGLTLLLAPTYAVRFSLFGLPTNLLMVWLFLLWFIFAIWLLARHQFLDFLHWLRSELTSHVSMLTSVFLLAGIVSLFVGGISQEKLGQFVVLFLQPIGTFIIFRYTWSLPPQYMGRGRGEVFVNAALLFAAVSGLYAIVQYFTLLGVPPAWWGNAEEPKRALAFFLHPNFYALFVTPLLAFLLPYTTLSLTLPHPPSLKLWWTRRGRGQEGIPNVSHSFPRSEETFSPSLPNTWGGVGERLKTYGALPLVAWTLGAVGLFLSLSRGGWLGLAVAIGVYLLFAGNRKLIKSALVAVIVIVIVIVSVPNFHYRLLLPFRGEKSSVARFSLWNTGWKMVKDSPVAGKGLLGFSNNWYTYNTDKNLEHYPAPHNIFLNFWVDTGLLGLITFFGLLTLAVWRGFKHRGDVYKLGLALACLALLTHGLIDIPYFKNDLALVFWMLFAFI